MANDNFEVFESGEISRALGMKLLYLNKFIERGLYGIHPSVRVGKGRGRRRLFSRNDVLMRMRTLRREKSKPPARMFLCY